jgi:hypothetical protein
MVSTMQAFELETSGGGYWSNTQTRVRVTDLRLDITGVFDNEGDDYDEPFGELRVYFDTATWDVNSQGLIYTDPGFFAGLKQHFESQGIDVSDLSYSEQGMQGTDYVSLDVGGQFIDTWSRLSVDQLLTELSDTPL